MEPYSKPKLMARLTLIFLLGLTTGSKAFLLDPEPQCTWYGKCGTGWNRGNLNCPATGAGLNAPLMTDHEGLQILKDYCPDIYKGDSNTRTCCDVNQLKTLKAGVAIPMLVLSSCPACLKNFLDQVCQVTCSPHQASFTWTNSSDPYPTSDHNGLPGIYVALGNKFAKGFFDSCKDLNNGFSISLFCGGETVDKCTPQSMLSFLGSISNGQAPFPIRYFVGDADITVGNKTVVPFDKQASKCSEPFISSSSVIGKKACQCKDCAALSCNVAPTATKASRKKHYDDWFGAGAYTLVELVVARKDSQVPVTHNLPPPSVDTVKLPSVFDKGFLKQVLTLQQNIIALQTSVSDQAVSLNNVCMKSNTACVVDSVTQFYQNSAANIEQQATDASGFFVRGDYLDHFLACKSNPGAKDDGTALQMSCLADYGNTTWPYMVFQSNETELVISFLLQDNNKAAAWRNEFVAFMANYTNKNMTITYRPTTMAHIQADPKVNIVVQDVAAGPGYSIIGETEDAANDATADGTVSNDATADATVSDNANDAADPGWRPAGPDDEKFDGQCIWYDQCGPGHNGGKLNCAATNVTKNAPFLTDPHALDLVKKLCGDFYKGPNKTRTCCSPRQIVDFAGSIDLPEQLLSRCPSCYRNFLNEICYMTCSPVQSYFLTPDFTKTCPSGPCNGSLPGVTYYVTPEYANTLYDSCKDVQMPSANDKAMSLFCGMKADKCTPKKWLDYMGSTTNGKAPFSISYVFSDKAGSIVNNQTINPLNITNVGCNSSYSNESFACSCQDCQTSCAPVPPPPPPKKPCKIITIDCAAFIASAVFIVFVICFGLYVICYSIIKKNSLGVGITSTFDNIEIESQDGLSTAGSQKNLLGHNPISPADIGGCEKVGLKVERMLNKIFSSWGTLCAKHPLHVVLVSIIVFGSLAGGIARYDVTTDPVKLWSAKTSTARMQKDYFDSHFGPFYRTEQVIISRPNDHTKVKHNVPPPSVDHIYFTSLFEKDFMHQVLDLQTQIQNIQATYRGENVTLGDICFKPLAPDHEECTIESVMQYWQNNHTKIDMVAYDASGFFVQADYLDHFQKCTQAPASLSDNTALDMGCLGIDGVPNFPWVILGGYDATNYKNSTAFVMTFVVNNHLEEEKNGKAEAWEAEFIKFMKNYNNNNMTVAFNSERSIQDELNRESKSDIWTIVISYLIMFGYISVALGQFNYLDTVLIDSKITLGIGGVTIVLLSVAASVGLYSFMSVPMTLIIIEVVPFLVLAVGVDNIFILVQTYQRDQRRPGEELEDQIGRILGQVGPSMLLTSFSESIAFFLGALTDMPAVREFALYAAMAVLFDFLLQITCFISLMTLDARRQESNRFDICCCLKLPKGEKDGKKSEGFLYWIVNNYYSHAVMDSWVRPVVMVVFVGWFLASAAFTAHLNIGLDQSLSMPEDSYVLTYFKNLNKYLSVGPPVYFVVPEGYDYSTIKGQNGLCGGNGCPQDSLIAQVFHASQLANYSYVAQPASSWIDDYFDWIHASGNPPCCRLNNTGGFCPSTSNDTCSACPFQPQISGRPTQHDFMKYLPMFLVDNPGLKCAKGGHAAYGHGVNLIKNKTAVGASYFMTYHTILKTSGDYINALKEARVIAKNISVSIGATGDNEVFPYSIFYVFYEQYLTIVRSTVMNIGVCMAAIFVATFFLLGFDFASATLVCFTILMIITDIMGMMYLWDIDLNALTLVNLVMAIGISVEFCSHIARAFAISIEVNRVERAKDALAHMGSSVLSGITLTKLWGIIILAFAKSQLFQVFYFRMYLGMVVFGATHGLIFLPVLLSYIGPGINKAKLYEHQISNGKDSGKLNGTTSRDNTPRESYRQIGDTPPHYNSVH